MCTIQRWRAYEIGFHDLDFQFERVLCQDDDGNKRYRWLPFGMPQLKPSIKRCVFFAFGIDPKLGTQTGPGGSGVIVSRQSNDEGPGHLYAVTNWHVALSDGLSFIRLNTKSGSTRMLKRDLLDWLFITNADDIAAVDITDDVDLTTDEITAVPEKRFVTSDFIDEFHLGLGEDIFMIGMLANSPGVERNMPVARFGNVSRLATDRAPIKQPNGVTRPCHLTDMRSRTGFSGSPVFVYRTPSAELLQVHNRTGKEGDWEGWRLPNYFLELLGVHCGQFDEPIKAEIAEALGDPLHIGDKLKSPSAMNIVVPASSITELLDHPQFEAQRMAREKSRMSKMMDVPRAPVD